VFVIANAGADFPKGEFDWMELLMQPRRTNESYAMLRTIWSNTILFTKKVTQYCVQKIFTAGTSVECLKHIFVICLINTEQTLKSKQLHRIFIEKYFTNQYIVIMSMRIVIEENCLAFEKYVFLTSIFERLQLSISKIFVCSSKHALE